MNEEIQLWDVIVVGGGPGGMTAALYAGRGQLSTLLINRGAPGGMMLMTLRYENFPGYPGGIDTFELAQKFEQHMLEHGVKTLMDTVNAVKILGNGPLFEVTGDSGKYHAKSVIIATGSSPRMLEAKGAQKLFGRGVSICAVCDGAFYRDKDVAVIGGGESAVKEGIYLTKFARSVQIVHRRNELRANPITSKEAMENPKISFVWDSVPEEVLGQNKVEGLIVRNVKTNELTQLNVEGVFVYIGATGNSEFIDIPISRTSDGYIKTNHVCETGVPGLFAVGDVIDYPFKQAIIACGQGASAGLMVEKYVRTIPKDALEKYSQV